MTAAALVIGEALIDIVEAPGGAIIELPGGSPMNVAIGLGRLGRPVALATHLGSDARGEMIAQHLADSGASLVPGSRAAGRTSTARAMVGAAGSAQYEFDISWRLDTPELPAARVVHAGSIGAVLAPGAATVRQILASHRGQATISYDPNIRPALMGSRAEVRPAVEDLVSLADVVKASDEDLSFLYPGMAPATAARQWAGAGPKLVIVTRGGDGAFAMTPAGELIEVPASPATVTDTVGAGDSFMAGVLDGLWRAGTLGGHRLAELGRLGTGTIRQILTWAGQIAAITVTRAGASPPWLAELADPAISPAPPAH